METLLLQKNWICFGILACFSGVKSQSYSNDCFGDLTTFVSQTDVGGNNPDMPDSIAAPQFVQISSGYGQSFIRLDCASALTAFRASNLNSESKIILIIPGYEESCEDSWVRRLASAIHLKDRVRILCLDWSKGAKSIDYKKALSNSKLIGKMLEAVLKHLETTYDGILMKFHFIASGLGASLAAFAGKALGGRVGRITGLNPWSQYLGGNDNVLRLNVSDAKFVDVIHTDSVWNGVGERNPMGQIDFYPNGGGPHPECSYLATERVCHHALSQKLFIESLGDGCPLLGFKCVSFYEFIRGNCREKKTVMGYFANIRDASSKPYYSLTASSSPYIGKQLLLSFRYMDCAQNVPPYSTHLEVIFKDSREQELEHESVLNLVVLTTPGETGTASVVILEPVRSPPVSFFVKCNQKPVFKQICLQLFDIETVNIVTHVKDTWAIKGVESEIQCGREYELERKSLQSRKEL